jgi:hypothetical protein
MRPLQDQCEPTPYEDIERLFLSDMQSPIPDIFEEFSPAPIGVASLAQVHVGRLRETGQLVAVKVCLAFALYNLMFANVLYLSSYNILIYKNSVMWT